jgi:hypothetical protein
MWEIVNRVTGEVVETAVSQVEAANVVTAKQLKTKVPHFCRPAK